MRRWWTIIPLAVMLVLLATWGALALWFQLPPALAVSMSVIGGIALVSPVCVYFSVSRKIKIVSLILATLALISWLVWWMQLQPSHQRDWSPDVERLLESTVNEQQVEIRNVRDFNWRTQTDYTPNWRTEQYDLSKLESADLVLSYWMGPAIAHSLVSFAFSDGKRVVFSLEIRKERHEQFSALAGFFRQYEQVMIAATERDIIYVRTNVRDEHVALYRLNLTQPQLTALFLSYLDTAESIAEQPRFYNTLLSNCTTIIYQLAKKLVPDLPLDYRILLSGYLPEYVYEQGGLTPGYSLEELQKQAWVSDTAKQVEDRDQFSEKIRSTVPGMQVVN